jgi:hypothetical protein
MFDESQLHRIDGNLGKMGLQEVLDDGYRHADRWPTTHCALSDDPLMSGQRQPDPDDAPSSGSGFVALTRSPKFWVIMGYAALFGVVLAVAALAFLGLVKGARSFGSHSRRNRLGSMGASGGWR